MATRSKQSATDSGPGSKHNSKERAQWTPEDESVFAAHLLKRKAEVKDGATFDNPTWNEVAKEMDKLKTKGGEKTVDGCKTKWSRVTQTS